MTPAREAEFNDWYERAHIPELCRIPGFLNGTLFEIQAPPEGYPKNIVLYELENEQALDTFNKHVRKQHEGQVSPFTPGPPHQVVWRLVSKRVGP